MSSEATGKVIPLRLVRSEPENEVLYCRHGISCRNLATVLVTFCNQPPLPSCDKHARLTWEHHPNLTQIGLLGDYVDHFAAVREAALAPPDPPGISNGNGDGGHGGDGEPPAGGPPTTLGMTPEMARELRNWGIPAIISFLLGLLLCLAGAPNGTVSGSTPDIPVIICGVLFILAAIGIAIVTLIKVIDAEHQKYRNWMTTLTPGQHLGVEVAETAAVWAGTYAVHEGLKHHEEHSQAVAARRAANRERQHGLRQHLADMNQQYQLQQAPQGYASQRPVTVGWPAPPERPESSIRPVQQLQVGLRGTRRH